MSTQWRKLEVRNTSHKSDLVCAPPLSAFLLRFKVAGSDRRHNAESQH
jgi:hypothetical protein